MNSHCLNQQHILVSEIITICWAKHARQIMSIIDVLGHKFEVQILLSILRQYYLFPLYFLPKQLKTKIDYISNITKFYLIFLISILFQSDPPKVYFNWNFKSHKPLYNDIIISLQSFDSYAFRPLQIKF